MQAEQAPRHTSGEPKKAPERRWQPPTAPLESLATRLGGIADKDERISMLGAARPVGAFLAQRLPLAVTLAVLLVFVGCPKEAQDVPSACISTLAVLRTGLEESMANTAVASWHHQSNIPQ